MSSAEASGLADIKSIATAIGDAESGVEASAGAFTFGEAGAASPLTFDQESRPLSLATDAESAPLSLGAPVQASSDGGKMKLALTVSAGVLAVGVLALGGLALNAKDEPAPVVAAAGPTAPGAPAPKPDPAPDGVAGGVVAGIAGGARTEPLDPDPEPEAEPELVLDEDADEADASDDDGSGKRSGSARKHRNRSGGTRTGAGDSVPEPEPAPVKAPEPKPEPAPPPVDDAKKYGVDCLLDPTQPGCGGATKKKEKKETVEVNLPEKLTNAQVRDGFRKVKRDAKVCGVKHGIFPGTKVVVKMSISGATGKIVSAEPQGEYAGHPGGKCVADHLKQAMFPPFKKEVMGVTFPVLM